MKLMQLFKKKVLSNPAYDLLLDDLKKTQYELTLAYDHFEHVLDPDLIDSCIYQLNAVQLRYKFLLGRVKQLKSERKK
jgi:hypothetical protein